MTLLENLKISSSYIQFCVLGTYNLEYNSTSGMQFIFYIHIIYIIQSIKSQIKFMCKSYITLACNTRFFSYSIIPNCI